MKYVTEFRSKKIALGLSDAIKKEVKPGKNYRLMEFCGGHTHAIYRHGVQGLMPANVEFIHGPGCPVCVLPVARIDSLIKLVGSNKDLIICTYGDVLRVPASAGNSLQKAKASGADIRVVYSPLDAILFAKNNPQKSIIFFAIGFETTTPATAVAIKQAEALKLNNFFVYCNHVVTAAALNALLDTNKIQFNGILGPSHVSTILGSNIYQPYVSQYNMPIVVAGFEPLDVMQSALMLIRQINAGQSYVENEYTRTVSEQGNMTAQALMQDVFDLRESFEWRGLGYLPYSGLSLKEKYACFDAEIQFSMCFQEGKEVKGCKCPEVLRGVVKPQECKLFGKVCRPDNPMGACMVSSEGACAAHWLYDRSDVDNIVMVNP